MVSLLASRIAATARRRTASQSLGAVQIPPLIRPRVARHARPAIQRTQLEAETVWVTCRRVCAGARHVPCSMSGCLLAPRSRDLNRTPPPPRPPLALGGSLEILKHPRPRLKTSPWDETLGERPRYACTTRVFCQHKSDSAAQENGVKTMAQNRRGLHLEQPCDRFGASFVQTCVAWTK